MFARLFRPVKRAAVAVLPANPEAVGPMKPAPLASPISAGDYTHLAVIAGRFCLAYQGTHCTSCHDRCPVPGAIVIEQGLPRVVPDVCTGCRICHVVCPAPENAVRIVPRPEGLPPPKGRGAHPASFPFPSLDPDSPAG
jgi:Na+-translocating ferredoxin:NAD+ oxidoreductase RNF subunit RnfB